MVTPWPFLESIANTSKMKKILLGLLCCVTLFSCQDNSANQTISERAGPKKAKTSYPGKPIVSDSSITTPSFKEDPSRITVIHGKVDVVAKNCGNYVRDFVLTINTLGGHTTNYEFVQNKKEISTKNKGLDSTTTIYEIKPMAILKMRIPRAYTDSFIARLLALDGTIENLRIDEEDKTLAYTYNASATNNEDKNTAHYTKHSNAVDIEKSETDFERKFLWCDVSVTGTPYLSSITSAKASALIAPWYQQLFTSLLVGCSYFMEVVFALAYVWPILLIIGGGYYLYRKNTKK